MFVLHDAPVRYQNDLDESAVLSAASGIAAGGFGLNSWKRLLIRPQCEKRQKAYQRERVDVTKAVFHPFASRETQMASRTNNREEARTRSPVAAQSKAHDALQLEANTSAATHGTVFV
jgi:hypothetical protein